MGESWARSRVHVQPEFSEDCVHDLSVYMVNKKNLFYATGKRTSWHFASERQWVEHKSANVSLVVLFTFFLTSIHVHVHVHAEKIITSSYLLSRRSLWENLDRGQEYMYSPNLVRTVFTTKVFIWQTRKNCFMQLVNVLADILIGNDNQLNINLPMFLLSCSLFFLTSIITIKAY